MAKDPVCGTQVDEKTAIKTEYMGKTYYFCHETCKTTFEKNPTKYTSGHSEHREHHSCC